MNRTSVFRRQAAVYALAFIAALATALATSLAACAHEPAWLVARPGTVARVDVAPWLVSDEPEAALTDSAASSARDFTADATRPGDVRYEPIGALVRIERVLPGAQVALVHGLHERWNAYARVERLVPLVPTGTVLVAAGGFGGFADFYPTLAARQSAADRLATGTRLVSLGSAVAPYDPNTSAFVRLRVRVASGALRGRIGWIATAFTGLLVAHVPHEGEVAERACTCRLIQFETGRP